MNLARYLADSASAQPGAPALARGRDVVATYAEHAERSARIAGALAAEFGIAPGDRVAMAMANAPEYSEILFAVWHAGAVAVPVNAKLHPKEVAWIVDNSGAKICFAGSGLAAGLKEVRGEMPGLQRILTAGGETSAMLRGAGPAPLADRRADDLAWLFYTSGTTGRPKGAMLTHGNLRAMTASYFACVDDVASGDCIIHAAPMSHGSGLYLVPHVAHGAAQVIPPSGGFDPAEVLDLLPVWRGATLFFAPTMVTRLLAAPELADADLSGLKTIVYGGAPMYAEDCRRALAALGPKLVQIYGQGEAPMTITVLDRASHMEAGHPRYLHRLGSVGRAQAGVDVRVADTGGNPLPVGEIGEVQVRGDVVMSGYWRNPDATAQALKDGWLHTGDLGVLDDDGYLTLKDRSKDVIISGGSNIYPREVEEVLLLHPDVLECSVVGRPRADWGEEVVAFVVLRSGARPDDAGLDALCIERIARFKRPRAYRVVDALPKNNYGKVLKTALREMA